MMSLFSLVSAFITSAFSPSRYAPLSLFHSVSGRVVRRFVVHRISVSIQLALQSLNDSDWSSELRVVVGTTNCLDLQPSQDWHE